MGFNSGFKGLSNSPTNCDGGLYLEKVPSKKWPIFLDNPFVYSQIKSINVIC